MYRSPDEQSHERTWVYFSTCPHWLRVYLSVAVAGLPLVLGLTLAACVSAGVFGSGLAVMLAALAGGATYLRLSRKSVAAMLNPTEGTLRITDPSETLALDGLVFVQALTFGECSVTVEFLDQSNTRRSTSVWFGASCNDAEKLTAALTAHVKRNLGHRPM